MSKKQFDSFLEGEESKGEESATVNWTERRNLWLKLVAEFYKQVEEYLDEYTNKNRVKLHYSTKKLSEEFLGNYSIKTLTISIHGREARFDPVGANVIGAGGRIDLIGTGGVVKFVLVDKNTKGPKVLIKVRERGQKPEKITTRKIDWTWKIVTPPPNIVFIELSQDTLLSVIMEVVNG